MKGVTKRSAFIVTAAILATLAVMPAAGADDSTELREYKVPRHGTLLVSVPDRWEDSVSKQRDLGSTTIELTVPPDKDPLVLITVMGGANCRTMSQNPEMLQGSLEMSMRRAAATAEEGSVRMFRLRSESGDGFVFTASDAAPEEDGYKYLWQGVRVVAGTMCMSFTVLTNEKESADAELALRAIKDADFKPR